MSAGWGKVPVGDWEKIRSGSDVDKVDPGTYMGAMSKVRHIEPSDKTGGRGAWIVSFETTTDNEERWQNKTVEFRGSYHPNPQQSEKPEGYAKMNSITEQNLAQLITAANVEPLEVDGYFDLPGTLNQMVGSRPVVAFDVVHNDAGYQDLQNFRAPA